MFCVGQEAAALLDALGASRTAGWVVSGFVRVVPGELVAGPFPNIADHVEQAEFILSAERVH